MIAKEFVYTITLCAIRKHLKFFWIIKGKFCFTAFKKSKNNTIVCCLTTLFTAYRSHGSGSNCQTEPDYRLIKMGTLCGLSYVCLFNCFSTCFKDKKCYHSECFGFFGTFCFNICSGYFLACSFYVVLEFEFRVLTRPLPFRILMRMTRNSFRLKH